MAEVTKSSLQSLLSGAPFPQLPHKLSEQPELYHYLEALQEYLRRLVGNLNETNIINAITQITGLSATTITAWRYDTTSHKFQIKTEVVYALKKDAESGWTDVADGTQPVVMAQVIKDVAYSTSTHALTEDKAANVYVLERGSDTTGTVETAVEDTD